MEAVDIESLRPEAQAIAEDCGCELLHIRFKGNLLQLFLDKSEGGVTLDDCQNVSKQISAFLDVHEFGNSKYVLEVSSPGLDRELFGPKDYERFCGRALKVTFLTDPDRTKKTVIGRLQAFEADAPGGGRLTLREQDADREHLVALDDVIIARLEIEL